MVAAGIQFATTEGIAVLKFSEEFKRRSRFNYWTQRNVNWIISRGQQSLLWCVSPRVVNQTLEPLMALFVVIIIIIWVTIYIL